MSDPVECAIPALRAAYREGRATPADVARQCLDAARADAGAVWIRVLEASELEPQLARLQATTPDALPLYGVPFAIKDNIDLAGVPTTAACPAYAYTPDHGAPVVERLLEAGALPIGKTNLDQFATGLVGTRSPWGAVRNPRQPSRVAGGSSSGSAVAVAEGQVAFALGTDTAGSGRVPAAFAGLFGHKPTRGWLSTRGVVPACRSLDCVSVFSRTPAEAADVLAVAGHFDPQDAYARPLPDGPAPPRADVAFRFGVPDASDLDFDDGECRALFEDARARLEASGGEPVPVALAPFLEAARLLYEGPWVAERLEAAGALLDEQPEALHPVTREILEGARGRGAAEVFAAQHRLARLARVCRAALAPVECLLLPTTPGVPTRAAVEADPLGPNARLGTYTNFVNLLDLCASAVPVGTLSDGAPWGVTLVAPAGHDARLLARSARLQQGCGETIGAEPMPLLGGPWIDLVVCGAHLAGQPLNPQLTERGGVLVRTTRSAPGYRLFALPGGGPARPALVRGGEGSIEVEIWRLPERSLGSFLAGIAAPLGLGRVRTAEGDELAGFVCEEGGTRGAAEITRFGGWRGYLADRAAQAQEEA